jgi:hypothetical protein
MSLVEIGLAGIIIIMFVILMGIHVAFALILIGLIGLAMILGPGSAVGSITLIAFSRVSDYNFAVVPLFLLMSAPGWVSSAVGWPWPPRWPPDCSPPSAAPAWLQPWPWAKWHTPK